MLEIADPGVLATIQDAGRPDAAPLGVPRAGAADPLALSAANLLLGGDPSLPAIELTGGLPAVLAHDDVVVAVSGADLGLRVGDDGPWIRPGTSVLVTAGSTIRATAMPHAGLRTYLALAGGADVPLVHGSASTSPVGGFGGLVGRPLRRGDLVRATYPDRRTGAGHAWPGPGPSSGIPTGTGDAVLDVTDGPHRSEVPGSAEAILATRWVVGDSSDRVGLRLAVARDLARSGGRATTSAPAPTIHACSLESFPLAWGAIEVPPDGSPIVLLPDAPTVGGYPVPLVVTRAALPRLGQLRPGDRVRFRSVGREDARTALSAADAALVEARSRLDVMRSVW
jgi:5-oxoprolinase (ATP-hydrolysing) subunit C